MPQMQIQGPNGQVATLNIPDGASPEQIQQYAQQVKAQMEQQQPTKPEEATQAPPSEDGALVELARGAESMMDSFVLDGAERLNLLDEIAATPLPEDDETTFDEKVMARQQAMWDEVPAPHKFLIGVGQSVDTLKDWGLDALGLGDEQARKAEDAVFTALDENNQDASDAGELVGEIAQLYVGGAGLRAVGGVLGYGMALGRGVVGRTRQVSQFFTKYHPKTLETVAKSKEGRNLFKAAQKSDEAADIATKGLAKRADAIDDAVRKTQTLKVNRNPKGKNPMELRADMNANVARGTERAKAAQAEVKKSMEAAQKRAKDVSDRLKVQKEARDRQQMLARKQAKKNERQATKDAIKRSPGGF